MLRDSLIRYNANKPLIQPRGGRTTELNQKKLWEVLQRAGSDVLPLTIDSRTRLGQIEIATTAYENSKISGIETLNGFPLLSINIDLAKELISASTLPVSLRHGTPYAFELISRALEVGITEIEGGPLSYSLPYSRDSDLIKVVQSWTMAEIACRNSAKELVRETFGILTACLVPPIEAILVNVLECAFIETFRSGTPMASFGATGSVNQDLATVDAFREVYPWFLERLGLPDSQFLLAYHHWMGPFPKDRRLAEQIITTGTLVAKLMRADKVVTKTTDEALGIPTDEINGAGVKLVRTILDGDIELLVQESDRQIIYQDSEMLVRECKVQIEKLVAETKDISSLLIFSVKSGLVDPPFTPHRACRRNLKALRADDGSIRITQDQSGIFSDEFIAHESLKLGPKKFWRLMTADEVKLDLQYPFEEMRDS